MNHDTEKWMYSIVIVAGLFGVIAGAVGPNPVFVVFGWFATSIGSFLAGWQEGYESATEADSAETNETARGA